MSAFSAWCQAIARPVGDSTVLLLVAKWTVLLTMTWLAHAMLARGNPRWRVALWRASLAGVALVAVLSWAPPVVKYSFAPKGPARPKSRDRPRLNRLAGIKQRRRTRPCGSRSRHSIPSGYLPTWRGLAAARLENRIRQGPGASIGGRGAIWRPRERTSSLVARVDLADRRARPRCLAHCGEPELGASRPALIGGACRDRSGVPGTHPAPGMSAGGPSATDAGGVDSLPGGTLARRAADAGARV